MMLLDTIDFKYEFKNSKFSSFNYISPYAQSNGDVKNEISIIKKDFEKFKGLFDGSLLNKGYSFEPLGEMDSSRVSFDILYDSERNMFGNLKNPGSRIRLCSSIQGDGFFNSCISIYHTEHYNESKLFDFYDLVVNEDDVTLGERAKDTMKTIDFLRKNRIKDPMKLLME